MKATTILYTIFFATTTVLADRLSESVHHHFCYRPGEPCSVARRALDGLSSIHQRAALANAEAIAEPQFDDADADLIHQFCYRPGEPCSKLKRAADAAAEAMALPESLPEVEEHHFCYRSGEVCSQARRSALALVETLPFANTQKRHACYQPGEPCSTAKRAALAAAEAEAEAEAEAIAHAQIPRFCHRSDGPCLKSKRNATNINSDEAATSAAAQAQAHCNSPIGPCSTTKRFAAALAAAVAEPPATTVEPLMSENDRALQRRCYAQGVVCAVNARAVEDVSALVWEFQRG